MYILILSFIYPGYGVSITIQEMSSKATCYEAGRLVELQHTVRRDGGVTPEVKWSCTPK